VEVPPFLRFCCVLLTASGCNAPLEIPSTGPITLVVVGDTLVTRPIDARDAGVAALRNLVSGATLAMANLDVNVLEEGQQTDLVRAAAGGAPPWPFARQRDVATLRDLGIDVVSLANDHATDYGGAGLESTRPASSMPAQVPISPPPGSLSTWARGSPSLRSPPLRRVPLAPLPHAPTSRAAPA
jgi:hypothetical protein